MIHQGQGVLRHDRRPARDEKHVSEIKYSEAPLILTSPTHEGRARGRAAVGPCSARPPSALALPASSLPGAGRSEACPRRTAPRLRGGEEINLTSTNTKETNFCFAFLILDKAGKTSKPKTCK